MPLLAYIKPTNYCNVDCEHCYLPEEVRADKNKMSDEKLREVAVFLSDMAHREGHALIHIIWHGGEPMMLSPGYYENALSIFDSAIGADKYTTSFQTSLIPYRHSWAPLLKSRFGSFVGSSIDFSQRKVKSSSKGYIDLWLTKLSMARLDGIEVIPGMVPTKNEIGHGKEIVDWFVQNEIAAFNIERFSRYGASIADWPSNAEHASFLTEVFDAILARWMNGVRAPFVQAIAAGISGVLSGSSGDRWGGSCQREFIVVEPDGSINTCPDRASHEEAFSNTRDGAAALIASPARRGWIRIQNVSHQKPHCSTCEFNHWCRSGCPITPNGPPDGEAECSGYKSFLLHVQRFAEISPQHRDALRHYASPDYVRPNAEVRSTANV